MPEFEGTTPKRTRLLPAIRDWDTYRTVFTRDSLWLPGVRQICRDRGLAVTADIVAGYPGTCPVYVVDQRFVIKLFPPMVAADFERARAVYEWLPQAETHSLEPMRTPAVLAWGVFQDRIDWPYLILTYLPGQPWRDVADGLTAAEVRAAVAYLGQWLRRLHDRPVTNLGSDCSQKDESPIFGGAEAFLSARLSASLPALVQALPGLPPALLADLEQLLAETGSDLAKSAPALVHSDLTTDHLYFEELDGQRQLTGVIDWADAEVVVPDYEWAPLWFGPLRREPELLQLLLTGYEDRPVQLDGARAHKMLAHTLLHRFGADMIKAAVSGPFGTVNELLVQLYPWVA